MHAWSESLAAEDRSADLVIILSGLPDHLRLSLVLQNLTGACRSWCIWAAASVLQANPLICIACRWTEADLGSSGSVAHVSAAGEARGA